MRIIELQTENFQRITAVQIRPDGNVVQIGGLNGAGKSSLLDSIWAALGGGRAIPDEPIRKGQNKALIRLDLGDLKVTRTFARKEEGGHTTTLKVEGADGRRFDKAQDVLNTIWNAYAVDPMRFIGMKPDEQFDAMKGFVPDIDFTALAQANGRDYEARTTANRRAKELRAQADGIELPAGNIPAKVDVAALEKKLGDAGEHNTLLERRKNQRQAVMDRCEGRSREIAEYEEIIVKLRALQADDVAMLENADALPEPIDVTQVQADLQAARLGNAAAERAARKAELNAQASAAEDESTALTKAMDERDAAKQAAIAKAKMPVGGISFGDGCILLDGVPFAQGSSARRLRAGVEIAAAMNPKLRVVRISDGSLLDKNSMAWLAEFCAKNDLQAWVEVVGDGAVGFIIEEGHVKGQAPPAAEEDAEEGV